MKNDCSLCKITASDEGNSQQMFHGKQMGTLLLHCRTRADLFSPDEESYFFFSTRNISCEFLAFDGVLH